MFNEKMKLLLKNKLPWLLFLIPITIYFLFGTYHLARFTTADEHFWFYDRIPQYWDSLAEKKWKKTRVNDKPGITVAMFGGAGLLLEKNPESKEMRDYMPPIPSRPEDSLTLNKNFRLPILIFNALFSLFLLYVLNKILQKKWLSLIAASLIILSPTLLGISQIVNPDSFLWIFSASAILSFGALLSTGEKKFFVLAPLFLALSLLSKYSASILYPFLFIVMIIYFFTNAKKPEGGNLMMIDNKRLQTALWGYLATVLGSLVFFSIFMPAVFVKYKYLTEGTIDYPGMRYILIPIFAIWTLMLLDSRFRNGKITNWIIVQTVRYKTYIYRFIFGFLTLVVAFLLINAWSGIDFLKIHSIPFDVRQDKAFIKGTSLLQKIFLEFRQLTFSLHPIVLAGLVWIWIRSFIRSTKFDFIILTASSFLIIYFSAVITQGLLANIRYSIMTYPMAIIMGSIGIWDFFSVLKKKISPAWIFIGLLSVSTFSLWQAKPFYFNYTSVLLPKNYIITGAWGYGGYEAAEYINSLPGSEKFNVWADYQGTCEFIKGSCMTKNYEYNPAKYKFDYFVFSRRGQILDKQKKGSTIKPIGDEPVWELHIGNRPENFVKVYKAK